MSRKWNGNTSGDRAMTFAPGALATIGGAMSVVWIWRPASVHAGGVYRGNNGGGSASATINEFSDGKIYWASGASFKGVGSYAATNGWRIDAFTHDSVAATGALRLHTMLYSDGLWSHTGQGTIGDSPPPNVSVDIGGFSSTEVMQGEIAAVGVWGSVLSDVQIEGLTTQLAAWMALSPAALWAFNQTDVATPVLDLTGHGANQTARTGTTVSAAEPPGFNYSLSTAPTRFARFGGAWVPVTRQVRSGGLWVPVTN